MKVILISTKKHKHKFKKKHKKRAVKANLTIGPVSNKIGETK
jgi:hypothetical protein